MATGDKEDREELEYYYRTHPEDKGTRSRSFREKIITTAGRIQERIRGARQTATVHRAGKGRHQPHFDPFGGLGAGIRFEDMIGTGFSQPRQVKSPACRRKRKPQCRQKEDQPGILEHMNSVPWEF